MRRRLVPEILDGLATDDPAAQASRRDLRKINQLMFHAAIAASLINDLGAASLRRVADLGCGDGSGALAVLRRLGNVRQGSDLILIDARPCVAPATSAALTALGWNVSIVASDVFNWLDAPAADFDLMMTNLFLHHFEESALPGLLVAIAARATSFVATEPLRTQSAYLAARAVGLIGANAVTRHDAPASVRAGFAGAEIGIHWPGSVLFEGRRGLFTHAFAGQRPT